MKVSAETYKNQVQDKLPPVQSVYSQLQAEIIYHNYKMLLHLYCLNKIAEQKPTPKAPFWAISQSQQNHSFIYTFSSKVPGWMNSLLQFFPKPVRGSTTTAHN